MPDLRSGQGLAPHPTLVGYYPSPASKQRFLQQLFNASAVDYDRVERLLSWGSGNWYRRQALLRAGLIAHMRVLDVAVGTGLMAREAISIAGSAELITGIDPSAGMLRQATDHLNIAGILATAEELPLANNEFDFLCMGYALRHMTDLHRAFGEFFRVLRPGARLCILEITAPKTRFSRLLLKAYMGWIIPVVTRITTRRAASQSLWQYYWETIDACLPPEQVLDAMTKAGFVDAARNVELGLFSEYTARKPG